MRSAERTSWARQLGSVSRWEGHGEQQLRARREAAAAGPACIYGSRFASNRSLFAAANVRL